MAGSEGKAHNFVSKVYQQLTWLPSPFMTHTYSVSLVIQYSFLFILFAIL